VSNIAFRCERTPAFFCRQPFICDEAWALIAPLFPPSMTTGWSPKWALRLLLEAMLYLLRTGCQWRALPDAFPPCSAVQRQFYAWRGPVHLLVMLDHEWEGTRGVSFGRRHRQPVGQDWRGTKYDGGKKLTGLKRHILVDAAGRLLVASVSRADMHDSRAAVPLLLASRWPWPFIERVFADAS
jgi:transposase